MKILSKSVNAKTISRKSPLLLIVAALALVILAQRQLSPTQHDGEVISNTYMHGIGVPKDETRPFVGIVSCITSRTDRFMYKTDQLLREKLLPSIHATISDEEISNYRVEVIFGYDEGDKYWEESSNQNALILNLERTQKHIPVTFISLHKDNDRPNRIPFNELCQAAYDRGVHYLVRINDDTHFITHGWITLAVNTLQSFSPPNVGVVGPKCTGDASGERDILTHDMTYLPNHLAIFGTYYPPIFDNYYIDDWISRVYGKPCTKRLDEWEVMHNTQAFGTRYTPSFSQDQYLDKEVEEGKRRVQRFIDQHNNFHQKS
jgi:hypothetical protein